MRFYIVRGDHNATDHDVLIYLRWTGAEKGFVETTDRSKATWWSSDAAATRNLFKYHGQVDTRASQSFAVCPDAGTPANDAEIALAKAICEINNHAYPASLTDAETRCACGAKRWSETRVRAAHFPAPKSRVIVLGDGARLRAGIGGMVRA